MTIDWKQRAIEQWTADPCGPDAEGAEGLLAGRRDYAPWMSAALDYAGTAGLEVLDVGCGQGIDLCEYARAGAKVTGIDLTPRHVELAREHLRELHLHGTVVLGDAECLPFADERFDRVSSNGVLHHTPDMLAALREIRRVLRPDGRATILVYNRGSLHYWVEQVLRRGVLSGAIIRERGMRGVLTGIERGEGRPLVRVYRRRQFRQMLEQAGFRRVSVQVSPVRPAETVLSRFLPVTGLPFGWYLIGSAER